MAVSTIFDDSYEFRIGKGVKMADGTDVALIATGIEVEQALEAREILAAEGISASVINISTIKPLDEELVVAEAERCGAIVTCEEHSIIGGLGAAVCECLAEKKPTPVLRVGVNDEFGRSGPAKELVSYYHLDAKSIAEKAKAAIADGSALKRLAAMVEAQGGDASYILDTEKFEKATHTFDVLAERDGYIVSMNTESCGIASSMLGAGRVTIDSEIDFTAGIIIHKKTGAQVVKGEVLATMYTTKPELFDAAVKRYQEAVVISDEKPEAQPLIYARVTKGNVEHFA
jgi:hypothetical protein